MASQFQNRLVGTVILVALLVIFLPDLLDGNKIRQTEDTSFTKVPLRPELEAAKPALPVSSASNLQAQHQAAVSQAEQTHVANVAQPNQTPADANQQWQVEPIAEPVTVQSGAPAAQDTPIEPVAAKQPEHKKAEKPVLTADTKPVEPPKPKTVAVKPKVEEPKTPAPKAPEPTRTTSADPLGDLVSTLDKPKPAAAAQGSAWIIQLGAFKNVDSVNSIVSRLRAAGYPAHTIPRTPRQGQLNRVVVGPDVSREKLQAMLPHLNEVSALSGSVVAYNP